MLNSKEKGIYFKFQGKIGLLKTKLLNNQIVINFVRAVYPAF